MKKDSKIFVAGHRGCAGSSIVSELQNNGYSNLVLRTRSELDLVNQQDVFEFFKKEKPDVVFLVAVLPCGASNVAQKADFIYENLSIQNNVIHASYVNDVKKLIFFGSGYMYPKDAVNPLREDCMLTGSLEYGAYSFGLAKIAGSVMCESYNLQYGTNFITLALNNLYSENANFEFEKSRVLPALVRKFHLAKLLQDGRVDDVLLNLKVNSINEANAILAKHGISKESVEIWGSGRVRREFIHAKDLALASIFVMENIDFKDVANKEMQNTHINVGTGVDYSIAEVANMVKDIIGFNGELKFNISKPDSSMDRLMDCSKINNLGWKHTIELHEGIKMMYKAYIVSAGGGANNSKIVISSIKQSYYERVA